MSGPPISTTTFSLLGRQARDLMTPSPTCVFDTDPLRSAAEFLSRNSAVPVVDADRRVVGVLSRTDLARALSDRHAGVAPSLELERRDEGHSGAVVEYQPPARRISEVMTPHVVTVPADRDAAEVVKVLAERRIGRVFVVDAAQHLIGVISTADIINRLRPT